MGRAPIPDHFATVTIEQIPKRALRECILRYGKSFWQSASAGLAPMLLGPPSVYKSYGAAALAKALHERACVRVDWCNVPVTLNQLERKRFERATDDQIERWKQVPFLVIDDFGMIKMGTWQYNALAEIAMYRFDTGRPTCWTGNIEISGSPTLDAITASLQQGVGTQLTRRMMERSEGYRLYVP